MGRICLEQTGHQEESKAMSIVHVMSTVRRRRRGRRWCVGKEEGRRGNTATPFYQLPPSQIQPSAVTPPSSHTASQSLFFFGSQIASTRSRSPRWFPCLLPAVRHTVRRRDWLLPAHGPTSLARPSCLIGRTPLPFGLFPTADRLSRYPFPIGACALGSPFHP